MTEYIFVFILIVFFVLFAIFSRAKKMNERFRHNMDQKPILPPEPTPRRSLEETLKSLTQRYELEKPKEDENPAENLLQEVRQRRAKELAERNKSLREIPNKPVIPKLGNPIVESWETQELKTRLRQEKKTQKAKPKDMHFLAYRVDGHSHPSRYRRMLQNPYSARDAFVASEIFKTKF